MCSVCSVSKEVECLEVLASCKTVYFSYPWSVVSSSDFYVTSLRVGNMGKLTSVEKTD